MTSILAGPDCPVTATATRVPSRLTAAEVTATLVNFGPNGTLRPVVLTTASLTGLDRCAFPVLDSVTTQPPAGFVARTAGDEATAFSPRTRIGAEAEPTLVMT